MLLVAFGNTHSCQVNKWLNERVTLCVD